LENDGVVQRMTKKKCPAYSCPAISLAINYLFTGEDSSNRLQRHDNLKKICPVISGLLTMAYSKGFLAKAKVSCETCKLREK
jgi:hypothetical protein